MFKIFITVIVILLLLSSWDLWHNGRNEFERPDKRFAIFVFVMTLIIIRLAFFK